MAAPACDRSDDRVRYAYWTPRLHPRTLPGFRVVARELLLHCTHRHDGIGVIPPEVLVGQILPCVLVGYE